MDACGRHPIRQWVISNILCYQRRTVVMHFCSHCIWSRIRLSHSRRASVVRNLIPVDRVQLLSVVDARARTHCISENTKAHSSQASASKWRDPTSRNGEGSGDSIMNLNTQNYVVCVRSVYLTFLRRHFTFSAACCVCDSSLRLVLLYLIRRCCGSFDKIKTVCLPRSNRCVHCDLCICPLPSRTVPATSST